MFEAAPTVKNTQQKKLHDGSILAASSLRGSEMSTSTIATSSVDGTQGRYKDRKSVKTVGPRRSDLGQYVGAGRTLGHVG
ncbi:hypothetical protein Hypma_005599 [Hypsizygus marmoreus]|uniref:Uncharacterized protein n=1 Tax=Hypsizygus marmoreus TaxID=39966 RepID=A0A369JW60_HYPMA|nr:hypothetical protein Hypma_005599 [Hypsizygus marmoreus]